MVLDGGVDDRMMVETGGSVTFGLSSLAVAIVGLLATGS
jgi:hypothetical protein